MKYLFFLMLIVITSCTQELERKEFFFNEFPKTTSANAQVIFIDSALNEVADVCLLSNAVLIENTGNPKNFLSLYSLESFEHKGDFLPKGRGPLEVLRVGHLRKLDKNTLGFKSRTKYHTVSYDSAQFRINMLDKTNLPSEYFTFSHEFKLANDQDAIYGWDIEQQGDKELLKYNAIDNSFTEFGLDYPDIGLEIPKKTSLFSKSIVVKPDLSAFALIYSKFQRLRIYEKNGMSAKDIIHEDNPMPPKEYMTTADYGLVSGEILDEAYNQYYKGKSSDKYIYVCFYGKEAFLRKKETGVFGSRQIHVFDWEGNPVAIINLDRSITRFDVDLNDQFIVGYSESYANGFLKFDLNLDE